MIQSQVIIILGGYIAEKFILGNNLLSHGSQTDIQQATRLISRMYRRWGMGSTIGTIRRANIDQSDDCIIDNQGIFNSDISDYIKICIERGQKLLKQHIELYKQLVNNIFNKGILLDQQIIQICEYVNKNKYSYTKGTVQCIGDYNGIWDRY